MKATETFCGYVVQLDLDLHTVRLRDRPPAEGIGALVWEGLCVPDAIQTLKEAFCNETEVSAVIVDGRLAVELEA